MKGGDLYQESETTRFLDCTIDFLWHNGGDDGSQSRRAHLNRLIHGDAHRHCVEHLGCLLHQLPLDRWCGGAVHHRDRPGKLIAREDQLHRKTQVEAISTGWPAGSRSGHASN